MNWEAIGAIAETIGAAGVIASLLYLALQVRASTRASAVESKLVSARFQLDFFTSLVHFPELQEIMLRGRKDPSSLSREEYYRFSNLMQIAFGSFSAAHFQFREGAVSESDFYENLVTIRYFIQSPGCQQWWEKIGKLMYGPEFVAVIEAELQNTMPPNK
jgi:cyanate lyase